MDEKSAKTYIEQIQADAKRLTLKRIKDDREENNRVEIETKAEEAGDNKKKA